MVSAQLRALIPTVTLLIVAALGGAKSFAQQPPLKSQEISDVDGLPVLLKHLPDYKNVQASAVFSTDKAALEAVAGNQPVLDLLEFPPGTESVTAVYPQGRLLIIEYASPQASAETDSGIQRYIGTHPNSGFIYRRIGNYNTFVFGPTDAEAASNLLDQVKYEKTVQWLGEDPYLLKKLEHYMVSTSRDIMLATVLIIVLGLAASVLAGIAAGIIFFRFRDQKRASRTAFSDAGGLTRLNLDGLSE